VSGLTPILFRSAAYVGSVAVMDGYFLDILDLNALRRQPIKDAPEKFSKWVETQVLEKLAKGRPDVIGIGGIITQYGRIKQITKLCKKFYPDVPIVLGGGVASSLPEFMIQKLPVDIVVVKEGEVVFSEVLHRLEKNESLVGLGGIVYKEEIRLVNLK